MVVVGEAPASTSKLLPVRRHLRVCATGERSERWLVYCLSEERSVDLARCQSCAHGSGGRREGRAAPRYVACARAAQMIEDTGTLWRASGIASCDAWLSDHTPVGAILEGTSLSVAEEMSIEALAEFLVASEQSGVPVVGDDGHPKGIVTRTDVVRVLHDAGLQWEAAWPEPIHAEEELSGSETGLPHTLVGEAMTPTALSVAESAPISQAAALLAFEGVRQLVVTAPDGRAVGLVSALDIASWMARLSGYALGTRAPTGGNELTADGSVESQAEGAGVAPSVNRSPGAPGRRG